MNLKQIIISLQLVFIFALSVHYANAQSFVHANGTEFQLNGNPFYFSGANNYYLFYKPIGQVQEVMNDAVSLNLTVIRTWGFCDGTCADGNYKSFQSSPGVYNEATFQYFDRIIKEASDRNLKLTIPLVNSWNVFGGMCQYVKWCNIPNASICNAAEPWPFGLATQVHDAFYTNNCTRQIYKNYVNYFLNRNNTLTGIRYKDDPTIFAWELANEPRGRADTSTVTLNNWIGEMSTYIKTIDSNHMVTPGSDGGYKDKPSNPSWSWWYHGNEGQDFIGNHQWPSVDFSTFRYYPEAGKFDDVNVSLWIQEHIEDSHNIIGKPVVMEEFGSAVNKTGKFSQFYSELESHGVDGDTFWLLADSLATGNDGYFVFCPGDAVCSIISNHANYMNNLSGSKCVVPANGMIISSNTNFCPGQYSLSQGITINSSNVVLNCNNTHIIGNGSVAGIKGAGTIDLEYWGNVTDNLQNLSPILNDMDGFLDSIEFVENVIIKNCNISNFGQGINTTAFKNLVVQDNEIFGNDIGISYMVNYLTTTIDNIIHDNNKGAFAISINSSFQNNEVYGNSQEGVIDGGINNVNSYNTLHGNNAGLINAGFNNIVRNNNASNNAQYGIGFLSANQSEAYNNIASFNKKGIVIAESSNVKVHDNTANNNEDGITVSGLFSQGTTSAINISNNIAMQNSRGGIILSDGNFAQLLELVMVKQSSQGHHVTGSFVVGNTLDNFYDFGIIAVTGDHVQGNLIVGNIFNGGGVYDQYPGTNSYCDAGQGNTYGANATIAPGDCPQEAQSVKQVSLKTENLALSTKKKGKSRGK